MFDTYKYAILRVIPDARRGECVNIGVVVFRPAGVDVRILPSLAKVRALDATLDLEDLYSLPERIEAWVSTSEPPEQQLVSLENFGTVSVSNLGMFECRPDQYERNVRAILDALVKPPAAVSSKPRQTRIQTDIRRVFKSQGILGHDVDDIERRLVVPDYPISSGEDLYADFVLRNGGYHVTETIDYRVNRPRSPEKQRETGLKAIKLHQAAQRFGSGTDCILVYYASADAGTELVPFINLLSEYAREVLNLESHMDRDFYFRKILEAAGDQVQLTSSQQSH